MRYLCIVGVVVLGFVLAQTSPPLTEVQALQSQVDLYKQQATFMTNALTAVGVLVALIALIWGWLLWRFGQSRRQVLLEAREDAKQAVARELSQQVDAEINRVRRVLAREYALEQAKVYYFAASGSRDTALWAERLKARGIIHCTHGVTIPHNPELDVVVVDVTGGYGSWGDLATLENDLYHKLGKHTVVVYYGSGRLEPTREMVTFANNPPTVIPRVLDAIESARALRAMVAA